jgi:hypothetical protein
MMASGKTEIIQNDVVHKSCIVDYKLRLGLDYREVRENVEASRA